MSKTILLAVDAQHYAPEATEMARELSQDTGDNVIVLHVHEFAVGRFGRLQVDCPEGEAERLVTETVAGLRDAGVTAAGEIRETGVGHIARTVLAAADEHAARIVVLGASGRTDLPHLPFGGVSHRLLHLARRPVLVVPRRKVAAEAPDTAAAKAARQPAAEPAVT
jgi:nucleotide-binding universal stress UspA family protein